MTISTSLKIKNATKVVFILWAIFFIVLIYSIFFNGSYLCYSVRVSISFTAFVLIYLYVGRRFLTSVTINPDEITSSLFMRTKCIVKLKDTLYYVIMSKGGAKKYIVLSGEPFLYNTNSAALLNPFYLGANLRKQIILPYSQEVYDKLSLEKWNNMEDLGWDEYQEIYNKSFIIEKYFGEWFSFPGKTFILVLAFSVVIVADYAVLLLNAQVGTVIVCVIITLLVFFVLIIIQARKPYLYLWLFVSRKMIRSKILKYTTSVNYASITEDGKAVVDFNFPTYYTKKRISNINHHATNYIFVSNNRLAIQRLKAAKFDLDKMDLEKVVPVIWCKSTAKLIDLRKFESVE